MANGTFRFRILDKVGAAGAEEEEFVEQCFDTGAPNELVAGIAIEHLGEEMYGLEVEELSQTDSRRVSTPGGLRTEALRQVEWTIRLDTLKVGRCCRRVINLEWDEDRRLIRCEWPIPATLPGEGG